jgi:phage baseplate assembly protein W
MKTSMDIVWSDLHDNLISDSLGKLKLDTNIQAVNTSIKNILRTHIGERVMLPTFGFGFDSMMFESMSSDELDMASSDIKRVIEANDDRPEIIEVGFYKYPDQNTVFLGIRFRIRGFDEIFKFESPILGG